MKIRNGFVSNSSSSSFIIKKKDLTDLQIAQIKDYYFAGLQLGMNIPELTREEYNNSNGGYDLFKENMNGRDREIGQTIFCYMSWDISEEIDGDNDEILLGYTHMDNFNMSEFFNKIGIEDSKINWRD